MAEPSTAPRFIVDPLPHGSPARISHVDLTRYPVFDRRTGLPMVDASGAPVTAVREGVHEPAIPNPGHAPRPNPAWTGPQRRLLVSDLGCFEGRFGETASFDRVVDHCAALAKRWGITQAYGDQFLGYALQSAFASRGISFAPLPWTQPSKVEAASTLRRLLRERTIVASVEDDEAAALRRDLVSFEERILPSGGITVQAKRSGAGHADRGALVLLVARAESEGLLYGSPIEAPHGGTWHDPYSSTSGTF